MQSPHAHPVQVNTVDDYFLLQLLSIKPDFKPRISMLMWYKDVPYACSQGHAVFNVGGTGQLAQLVMCMTHSN